MTLNGFLSRLKSSERNQAQEIHPDVPILKQRLSELRTQWCICGETENHEQPISLEGK